MEFVHEDKDYNVAEFYEQFRDYLPKVVVVNQGFCGEIVEDTFDKGQSIRVHAISKQPRVIAKLQYARQSKMISIPVTYDEKFCIVKRGGKSGKPEQIYKLLKANSLPIAVQFPKDHTITVGNRVVCTNNIPSMELIKTFDEIYLLGNFITDDGMSQDVVHVPLYLSQLRLSVVTGISGQSKQMWAGYQEELERFSNYIEYDQEFGSPNIAEYDPSAIHSDTTYYSYVEPTAYSTFARLVQKPGYCNNTTYELELHRHEDPNVYEEIENTSRQDQAAYAHTKTNTPEKEPDFKKQLETALQTKGRMSDVPKRTSFKPQQKSVDTPPPVAPKPRVICTVKQTDLNIDTHAPPVPERKSIPQLPKTTLPFDSGQALYSNDVPRTRILPTMHKTEICKPTINIEGEENTIREVNNSADVACLTVDDVCGYLKKLKLDKYASDFKEQLIDGATLIEIDRDMLKEDFGMKSIEALRLLKFAKDGHIPR